MAASLKSLSSFPDAVMRALPEAAVQDFQERGAGVLRAAFAPFLDGLAAGVARNEREPGPHAENSAGTGRFFNDYCNWRRIPEYRDFVLDSPAAALAARAMRSATAQLFHEHLLIKEPGTALATPWHHDMPYYNVEGTMTVSLWLTLDPVPRETCPQFVAGSHRWGKLFYPRYFRDGTNYPYAGEGYEPVPDIDARRADHEILSWDLEPGDALLFNFLTLHGAPANLTARRRRSLSLRWLGEDARYVLRPGPTSPPFGDIGQRPGEPLRRDLFPLLWPRDQSFNPSASLMR